MIGHKVTLCHSDGETETIARYPNHDDATKHLEGYCYWDDAEWNVENGGRMAESEDGRRLTISPTPVYEMYHPGNVEDDPRNGVLEWQQETSELESLTVIPSEACQPDHLDGRIRSGTMGVVLENESDLDAYFSSHKRDEAKVPKYYSRFPDDPKSSIIEGPPQETEEYEGSALSSKTTEASIRVLTGGGRYSASEFTIHNCLPYPCVISREDVGHLLVAPQIQVHSEEDIQSSRSTEA